MDFCKLHILAGFVFSLGLWLPSLSLHAPPHTNWNSIARSSLHRQTSETIKLFEDKPRRYDFNHLLYNNLCNNYNTSFAISMRQQINNRPSLQSD